MGSTDDPSVLARQSTREKPEIGDRVRVRYRGMSGASCNDVGELVERSHHGVLVFRDTDGHHDHLWVPQDHLQEVVADV